MTEAEVTEEVTGWGHIRRIRYIVDQGVVNDIVETMTMDQADILSQAIATRMAEGLAAPTDAPVSTPPQEEVVTNGDETPDEPVQAAEQTEPEQATEEAAAETSAADEPQPEVVANREEPAAPIAGPPVAPAARGRGRSRINAGAAYEMLEEVLAAVQARNGDAGAFTGAASTDVTLDLGPIVDTLTDINATLASIQGRIDLADERLTDIEAHGDLSSAALDSMGEETSLLKEKVEFVSTMMSQVAASIDTGMSTLSSGIGHIAELSAVTAPIIEATGVALPEILDVVKKIGPGGGYSLLKTEMFDQLIAAASGNFQSLKKEEV